MLVEAALLVGIYLIWIVTLVNAMISSEEISLTIATLPFIVTFPIAFLLSILLEVYIPNIVQVDIMLTAVVGILIFVRWIMAIVGE